MSFEKLIKTCFKNIKHIKFVKSFSRPLSNIYIYLLCFNDLSKKKIFLKVLKGQQKQIGSDFYNANIKKLNRNSFIQFPEVFYCENGIIIQEFIEGKNLEDLFFKNSLNKANNVLYTVGRGLRAAEDMFDLKNKDKSISDKLLKIKVYLDLFPSEIKQKLKKYIGRLDNKSLIDKEVINFGDVQLKNVILNESKGLFFVDTEVFFGSRFMDAALLVYNIKRHLMRPYFFFQKDRFNKSIAYFLKGFFREKIPKLFEFNIIYLLIQNYILIKKSNRFLIKNYVCSNLIKQLNFVLDKGIIKFIES